MPYSGLVYPRNLTAPGSSFFLFGPRGTGKSTWIRQAYPRVPYIDLLEASAYMALLAAPDSLAQRLPAGYRGWVIIDEIQKLPALLDEVHRLHGQRRYSFAMTGSSARKLRRGGVNLLAGRALVTTMHPLTCAEMGAAFNLRRAVRFGQLPGALQASDPGGFLAAYVHTYVQQEVQQEGLTRNLAGFGRFLQAAALSVGAPLNVSAVARDCHVDRKVVEDYFTILEDLLLGVRLPVFSRRAKRALLVHQKFFYFDAGVYQTLRPRGPLDDPAAVAGHALETLVCQQVRAVNAYHDLGYALSYWQTATHREVDLVLYGERGLIGIEVKAAKTVRREDLAGLRAFGEDYPMAQLWLIYGGDRVHSEGERIQLLPAAEALRRLPELLAAPAAVSGLWA